MATTLVSDLFTDIRYDLRDHGKQKYDDTYLLNMLNRGIKVLDRELIRLNSDLVIKNSSGTITSGNNFLTLDSTVDSIKRMYIDQNELQHKSMEWILRRRIDVLNSSTGEPKYFATWVKPTGSTGRAVAFDYTANQDYTINYIYSVLTSALVIDSYLPYDDMFNGYLREGVVTLCQKAKDDKIVQVDFVWREMFRQISQQIDIASKTAPKYYHLDF